MGLVDVIITYDLFPIVAGHQVDTTGRISQRNELSGLRLLSIYSNGLFERMCQGT